MQETRMTPESLSCPYCNAQFTLPAAEAGATRVRCPRCGDTFPHRPTGAGLAAVNGPPAPAVAGPGQPAVPARPPAWPVARVVVAIMAGMAVVGLIFALATQSFRRQIDRSRRGAEAETLTDRAPPTPPAQLAGLGYLPADTAVVAGLHLAELWQDPEGNKLVEQLRRGPAGAALAFVENQTGLKQEDIDHVVAGVDPAAGLPRVILVVSTRRPVSEETLARALVAARPEKYHGRRVYRVSLGPVGEGLIYQAGEQTVILSLGFPSARLEDLDAIPRTPRPGAEGLPTPVRECLQDRLDNTSLLWAVGAPERLPVLSDLLQLQTQVPEEVRELAAGVKAFSVGLRLGKGVTLGAALQGKDEETARRLADDLEKHPPQGVIWRVVGPSAGADRGNWVLVQASASPEVIAQAVSRLGELIPGGHR
jgi:predicted Zn finger-like uncharacterized protein